MQHYIKQCQHLKKLHFCWFHTVRIFFVIIDIVKGFEIERVVVEPSKEKMTSMFYA